MLTYSYKAKNSEGVLIAGALLANHREAAINILQKRGYHLLRIDPEGRLARLWRTSADLGRRVTARDRAVFTHQLATLLRAGVRLTVALKTLIRQTQNKYFASVIAQLQSDIEQSSSLSQAMSKHPRVFSQVDSAIVAAAEQSGALAGTLAVLSARLKSQSAINARVRGAMIYPVFLLVVSGVVVGVLTTFVVPKFIQMFVDSNQTLPLPTRMLIAMTDLLRQSWWILLPAILGFFGFALLALRQEPIRRKVDGTLLWLPLLGPLFQKIQLARFSRTLGSLLDGGVRLVEALETTKRATANRAFAEEVAQVGQAVLKGQTLTKALSQQRHFSEIAVNIVSVGEDSGLLPAMLLEVADMSDQESEAAISAVTGMLGPVMIVLLGLIVGFVVMAILLPIFETSTLVQ
jgi:type II secretory pathway component PulF